MSKEIAEYHIGNSIATMTVGVTAYAAAAVPTWATSEPGHPHPLREMDPLGIPNLFDHTGSMDNAALVCAVTIFAGSRLYQRMDEDKKGKFIAGAAVASGTLSGGAVIAAETTGTFDTADVLYAIPVSVLYPAVFAIAALKSRASIRRKRGSGS